MSDFTLFIFEAIILFIVGGALAFAKVNHQPIHSFLFNVSVTLKKPKLRVWGKEYSSVPEKELKIKEKLPTEIIDTRRKPLFRSKLSQIALLVDTGGRYDEEIENE